MNIKKVLLSLVLFSGWASIAACQQVDHAALAGDYIKQGNACYANKEYPKALSIYTKAANEDPKSALAAIAHYKCAKTLETMGKYKEAVSESSKAIAIDPMVNNGLAYLLRALAYEKTGKYIEAVSDYSKALIINPEDKMAPAFRQRLLIAIYTKLTKDGVAAFNNGLASYKSRKDAQARKDLSRAASLFAYAMNFDIGDKTAFAMASFTKGLTLQIMTREILDAIKPGSSDKEAMPKLVSAYYTLAVTNAYYEKALPLLHKKLEDSIKELKAINDEDMAMIKPRLMGLEARAEKYIKAADLEAACMVNFDAASQSIAAGDHDEAGRILDETDSMVSDLKKLKSANADGMRYLINAYAGLNTIFSYPLTDRSWLKENKTALNKKISDCLKDIGNAKSSLVNKELVNSCSRLLKNVSSLKDMFEKIGEKS